MNKGKKTTLIALVSLALIIALFVGLFTEIVTPTELRDGINGIVAAAVIFIGWFSKDSDQTHSKNLSSGGHPDPKKEEK